MRELNNEGTKEFSSIDEKYDLKSGSAQYTYHKLLEEKMIFRVTMVMNSPPIKDVAVIIAEQINIRKFNARRKEFFIEEITDSNTPLNKYVFEGDVGAPYGVIFVAPIYKDGELELLENTISRYVNGARIRTSVVTTTLTGILGFRKIDMTKTNLYDVLVKDYKYGKEAKDSHLVKNTHPKEAEKTNLL